MTVRRKVRDFATSATTLQHKTVASTVPMAVMTEFDSIITAIASIVGISFFIVPQRFEIVVVTLHQVFVLGNE